MIMRKCTPTVLKAGRPSFIQQPNQPGQTPELCSPLAPLAASLGAPLCSQGRIASTMSLLQRGHGRQVSCCMPCSTPCSCVQPCQFNDTVPKAKKSGMLI